MSSSESNALPIVIPLYIYYYYFHQLFHLFCNFILFSQDSFFLAYMYAHIFQFLKTNTI